MNSNIMCISKVKILFLILFLVIVGSSTNCASEKKLLAEKNAPVIRGVQETLEKIRLPEPLEADIVQERIEAEKLIKSGITFVNTMSTHGTVSEKGFEYSSNEFKSSDGVDLTLQAQLYRSPVELNRAFDKAMSEAVKVFEKTQNKDGERRFDGANKGNALVVYVSGSFLYTVFSPSLRHLIAFETKEPGYFAVSRLNSDDVR